MADICYPDVNEETTVDEVVCFVVVKEGHTRITVYVRVPKVVYGSF